MQGDVILADQLEHPVAKSAWIASEKPISCDVVGLAYFKRRPDGQQSQPRFVVIIRLLREPGTPRELVLIEPKRNACSLQTTRYVVLEGVAVARINL